MPEEPKVLIYDDIEWDDVLRTAAAGKAGRRESRRSRWHYSAATGSCRDC